MANLIVSEFLSLDSVMEGPGPDDPFRLAGWSAGYGGKDFLDFKLKELFDAGALLMGEVTYQGFFKVWPTRTDDMGFSDAMNSIPKYVVSNSLKDPIWNNTTTIGGDIVAEVKKLKATINKDILVYGSSVLAETLFNEGLVDNLTIVLFPVVVGEGKKMFKDGESFKLDLVEARAMQPGAVLLKYNVAKKEQ
ncbi:MAG TPA: dihydrofolate reductase family protein [Candidatus Saccharimonadales bacterium]|nr:dihydrofolate reductase family protein [Candidatus Saccharimonadales bacterium]